MEKQNNEQYENLEETNNKGIFSYKNTKDSN